MDAAPTSTCAFPGCDRPTAPPPRSGGRSRYCTDPAHSSLKAFRVRQRARASASAPPQTAEKSISAAAGGLRETLSRLQEQWSELVSLAEATRQHGAQAGDPGALEAETTAVRAAAAQQVAAAEARAAEAEQ